MKEKRMNKMYACGCGVKGAFGLVPLLFVVMLLPMAASRAGEIVPDISSLELDSAQTKIEGARFMLGAVSYECDDTIPAGAVIKQIPAAGTVVGVEVPVDVVISTGGCDDCDSGCCGCAISPHAAFLGVLAALVLIVLAVVWGGTGASPAGIFK